MCYCNILILIFNYIRIKSDIIAKSLCAFGLKSINYRNAKKYEHYQLKYNS